MNLVFWLNFLSFIIAITIAWYIPGRVILGADFSQSKLIKLSVSYILGLVFWSWQGYVFGYLGMGFLTYAYLALFLFLWLKKAKIFLAEWKFSFKEIDKIAFLILVLGIFAQNVTTWGSGLKDTEGIRFFRLNSLDGVMHLAYIKALIKQVPPIEPGLNGEIIRNYHYWSDLTMAEITQVFNLSVLNSFFQYSNFFLSIFLGLSAYGLMRFISPSKTANRWFLFLIMLGGDWGYLLLLLLGRGFLNFNVPTFDNAAYLFQNPPWAYSVIVLLGGLIIFQRWLEETKTKWGILTAIVFASLVGFKIYTGILVLSGLGLLTLYFLFKKRGKMIFVFPMTIILSLIVYLPNNLKAGGLFLAPFEWTIKFLTQGDVGLGEWELRRRTYLVENNLKRVLQMEIMMSIVFFFSHFGIKLLGLIPTKKIIRLLGVTKLIFFYGGIAVSLFLGLFFLQKTGGFNSFNFFNTAGLFLTFPTALLLADLQERLNRFFHPIFIVMIVSLVMPRVISESWGTLVAYYQKNSTLVSNEELIAYDYLKTKTTADSLVLVYNNKTIDGLVPIVSFFSERPMFLSGQWFMSMHDLDFAARQEIVDKIFLTSSIRELVELLRVNGIDYIYLPKEKLLNIPEIESPLSVVFKNNEATIIKLETKENES